MCSEVQNRQAHGGGTDLTPEALGSPLRGVRGVRGVRGDGMPRDTHPWQGVLSEWLGED